MKKTEDRKTRFQRVATRRTEKILEDLRILGNCANRGVYNYNEGEIGKIFSAIEERLRMTKLRFKSTKKDREKFTL